MWDFLRGVRFTWRWHPHLGPFYANITNGRWNSTAFRWGRFTHNLTTGRTTVDTPGPGSVSTRGQRSRRRRSERLREQ